MAGIKSYVPSLLGAVAAGLIALLDTTIWLSICFAFAGPMFLGGLYEAMLDSRVLEFLREKIHNGKLTLDMRCRCLMLILVGNLDLALDPQPFPPGQRSTTQAQMDASPWRHMEAWLYKLRLYDDDNHSRGGSPRQQAHHHEERPRPWTLETKGHIARTKTRLRTMLQCQYSFGSVVGAPVVFFLGGFFFAYFSSLENLGDEYIAESIAFGSWYMIIPHIAIVSGLLLAGNNPSILEGVFATERDAQADDDSATTYILFGLLRFELAYPSCYKVAWQWQRGHTKKQWINQLLRTYKRRAHDRDCNDEYSGISHASVATGNRSGPILPRTTGQCIVHDNYLEDLRARTSLSPLDWFHILSLTLLLLGVPFVLAFVNAYFQTPIGLACHTLTFTVYFCIQIAQIGLWFWAYAGQLPALNQDADAEAGATHHRRRGFRPLDLFRRGGWLDTSGFYTPTSVDWLLTDNGRSRTAWEVVWSRDLWSVRAMWSGIYYFLVAVFGLGAIFSSIGGTLMQILGKLSRSSNFFQSPASSPATRRRLFANGPDIN